MVTFKTWRCAIGLKGSFVGVGVNVGSTGEHDGITGWHYWRSYRVQGIHLERVPYLIEFELKTICCNVVK